jgi:hypothetical protein
VGSTADPSAVGSARRPTDETDPKQQNSDLISNQRALASNVMSASSVAASPASWFSFPNPVNEVAARVVATGVVTLAVTAIALRAEWLVVVLAVGFALRVASGPRFSPLGLLATRVIVPRLGLPERMTPGPPKRFAQAIGLGFSTVSAVLLLVGWATAGWIVLGVLVAAAFLEAALGFCLGCRAFAVLIRVGVIPAEVCEACNDIWSRPGAGPRPVVDAD